MYLLEIKLKTTIPSMLHARSTHELFREEKNDCEISSRIEKTEKSNPPPGNVIFPNRYNQFGKLTFVRKTIIPYSMKCPSLSPLGK